MTPPFDLLRPAHSPAPSAGLDAFLASLSPDAMAVEAAFLASLTPAERAEHARRLENPLVFDMARVTAEDVARHDMPEPWTAEVFVQKLLGTFPPERVAAVAGERARLYAGDAEREVDDLQAGRHPLQRV